MSHFFKNKITFSIILCASLIIFFVIPASLFAQTKGTIINFTDLEKDPKNTMVPMTKKVATSTVPGTANCFDYYRFQSVQISVGTNGEPTESGKPVVFKGFIENKNAYPIVDGQIYIKIFKKNGNEKEVMLNADDVIDQGVIQEGIVLDGREKKPVTISWNVPEGLASGEYKIAFFFQASKRFNLLGLSFTDDVVGNVEYFNVRNDKATDKNVAFNKNSVTMNGKVFNFAKPIPRFKKDEPVTIKANLINPTNEKQTVSVTVNVYNWDSLQNKNLLETKTSRVELGPKETKSISYTETVNKGSVTYVVIEGINNGVKSILNTRFIREGVEETRINFPAMNSFPLVEGEKNLWFSCFHSTGEKVDNNELIMTLRDMEGNDIHSYLYRGQITSAMTGMREEFIPKKTYTSYSLTATLKHKGKVVDTVTTYYKCEEISPILCPKLAIKGVEATRIPHFNVLDNKMIAVIALSFIVVLSSLLYFVFKKYKAKGKKVTSTKNK